MQRAVVITVGARQESLGALKLARWLRRAGWEVEEGTEFLPLVHGGFDLVCFSAVFSWRLPALVQQARQAKMMGCEVWIGGPAVTFHPANRDYVSRETGLEPHVGLDDRFEREPGQYPMVYFSRGCPAYTPACGHCPVPRIEGNAFRYYPDATPAAMLLDNNLSALPDDYQEHIITRYTAEWPAGKPVDCNSGFEPHTFTEETLKRWERFPLLCWRFGYDDLTERDQALEMMQLLGRHGYRGKKVRVYCLIGNEPIAACQQRLEEILTHGCEPRPQRMRPLNWLGPDGTLPCIHDWDEQTLVAYQRYYACPQLWRSVRPEEFFYQGRYPLQPEAS